MKKIYWLRRTGAMLFMFGIGAALTGNVPDWLKAAYVTAVFGLVLIYDVAEYEQKKPTEEADQMRALFVIVYSFFAISSLWLLVSWIQITKAQKEVDLQSVMIIVLAVIAVGLSITFLLVSLLHKED